MPPRLGRGRGLHAGQLRGREMPRQRPIGESSIFQRAEASLFRARRKRANTEMPVVQKEPGLCAVLQFQEARKTQDALPRHRSPPEERRCSGKRIAAPKFYRQKEKQLGVFHRRGQKVRATAPKITNRRRRFLNVMSHGPVRHAMVREWRSPCTTSAGRRPATCRRTSRIATGSVMRVVAERCSSQTCSVCRCIPASSPKGRARFK
jgi:hypothetical protein